MASRQEHCEDGGLLRPVRGSIRRSMHQVGRGNGTRAVVALVPKALNLFCSRFTIGLGLGPYLGIQLHVQAMSLW